MDCYWISETVDVVENQAEYSSPNMYKLLGAYWLDPEGRWKPLRPTTPQKMDQVSWNWRNDPAQAFPIYIAFEGVSRYVIYPEPNYSLAGGLKFEGYASTNASGISTWPSGTAMHGSDVPSEAAKAVRLAPLVEGRYRQLRGHAEAAASTYYQDVVKVNLNANWLGWIYSR